MVVQHVSQAKSLGLLSTPWTMGPQTALGHAPSLQTVTHGLRQDEIPSLVLDN